MERGAATVADLELQERMVALVRAFGLHRPDETPCGKPVSMAEAHALMELSREDGPLVQKELAARLRLEKSTVSGQGEESLHASPPLFFGGQAPVGLPHSLL